MRRYFVIAVFLTLLSGILVSNGFVLNAHSSSNISSTELNATSTELGENASSLGDSILKKTQRAADEIQKGAAEALKAMGVPEEDTQFYVDNSDTYNTNFTGTQNSNSSDNSGADIVLLSQKLKKGKSILNNVVGQVKNIGNDTAKYIEIGLTGFDETGDVMGTKSTYSKADTLKPNQKSSFDILLLKDDFNDMETYELSLQWQSSDGTEEYIDNAQVYKDE